MRARIFVSLYSISYHGVSCMRVMSFWVDRFATDATAMRELAQPSWSTFETSPKGIVSAWSASGQHSGPSKSSMR